MDPVTERAVALVSLMRGVEPEREDDDVRAVEEALREVAHQAVAGRVAGRRPDWDVELEELLAAIRAGSEARARDVLREMTPVRAALLCSEVARREPEGWTLLREWLILWSAAEIGARRD